MVRIPTIPGHTKRGASIDNSRSGHLSSGYKRDLLALVLVNSIFVVYEAYKQEKNHGTGHDGIMNRSFDNKHYKTNTRIERRIESFMDTTSTIISSMYERYFDPALHRWYKQKTNQKVLPFLNTVSDKPVNLEVLAVYILFVTFSERACKRKLDYDFNELVDDTKYFEFIDLVKKAGITDDQEASMMDMAYMAKGMMQ